MQPLLNCRNIVGESIVWSDDEQCLYWVDIVGSHIHRFAPETRAHDCWRTPELPTSIGLAKDGGFIVGLRRRVTRWKPGGPFQTIAVPEPDLGGNRLNEGVVAPDGSFWVGTMEDNIGPDLQPAAMGAPAGSLYRIATDGKVERLSADRFTIPNSMVWLDDGRFVTADTPNNLLYVYAPSGSAGLLGERRLLPPIARGLPDGSARDTAGNIYNTRVAGGAAIARIDATTGNVCFIDLPCNSPTSCTFGGRDRTTLFVTSARFGLAADALEGNSHDGALFALEIGVPGVSSNRFG